MGLKSLIYKFCKGSIREMNNEDIRKVAMEQSAIDFNCSVDYFFKNKDRVVISKLNKGSKKCYKKRLFCGLAYYGKGVVATVDESIRGFMEKFLNKHPGFRAFDTPQLVLLNKELEKYGKTVCFIAECFLPDVEKQVLINKDIEVKILCENEIPSLYEDDRFHMALTYNNDGEKKDVLAVVGYIDGEIAGIAAVSNDCENMWQVGIDVLPEFRKQGVAKTLTKILTDEVIKREKVPYYCTAWSNIASKNNAISCGYKTTWVEIGAIDIEDAMKIAGE